MWFDRIVLLMNPIMSSRKNRDSAKIGSLFFSASPMSATQTVPRDTRHPPTQNQVGFFEMFLPIVEPL